MLAHSFLFNVWLKVKEVKKDISENYGSILCYFTKQIVPDTKNENIADILW